MDVATLNVSKEAAAAALLAYKQHRNVFDKRDWEIERIYRAISKGKTVISAFQSIRASGLDGNGRPKLAICEARAERCICVLRGDSVTFGVALERSYGGLGKITVSWPGVGYGKYYDSRCIGDLPRIPPQYRPAANSLPYYHLLWEADWQGIPRDPMLVRRIGKDAWVVLATWDLTDVEMNVLRSHRVHD